ncbi:MAG: LPS-assembly protein LptD [Deltaproteobacteria bacterium]|nr:LPS-assembly protein LptD [Deltaproteobacteria bacterium]MBW2141853.1 LPS-assembly protein LptD [Deltaproteobacteria bacterium]MBW2324141.1 LPS-assembly protein LptD [Deltaproteobacteria bacterium]
MRFLSIVLAAIFFIFLPLTAAAEQAKITVGGAEGWTITADQITRDSRTGFSELEGRVMLKHESELMEADFVRLHEKSKMVEVRGHVRLTSTDFTIVCERLVLDLENNTGKIYVGTIFFPSNNYYVSGDEIEKTGPDTFSVNRGRITNCDGPSPAWSFTARNIKIRREGYASATHATLSARNFPVFYTPLIVVPVKSKRQSGFLAPEIKTSDRDGTGIGLPYYWAISDSRDMTFTLNTMANRGQDYGLEFRYRDWGGKGTYKIDYINDQDPPTIALTDGSLETRRHRYWLRGKSDLTTESGFEIKLDLDLVSDSNLLSEFERVNFGFNKTEEQFFDEFGRGFAEARDPYRKTSLLVSKQVNPMKLNIAAEYTDNLDSPDNEDTLQRLPRINLDMPRTVVAGTPFFFKMDSGYTYFKRGSGSQGNRWDIYPRIYWPMNLLGWLDLDPSAGFHETIYYPYGLDVSGQNHGFKSREMFDVEIEMSSRFSRIFDVGIGRVEKIKHRLKPELTYRLISKTNQNDMPYFDPLDRISGEEVIEYGLVNYLVAKTKRESKKTSANGDANPGSSYYELLRLKLSRTYNLLEARRKPDSTLERREIHGPWKAEYCLNFSPYFQIEGQSEYDTYDNHFNKHTIEFDLQDKRGDKASVQYNFNYDNYEEIYYHLLLVLNKATTLEFENRYSLREKLNIETVYSLTYKSQCWAFRLEYVDRPDDNSLVALFSITGLNKLGSDLFKPGSDR